MMKKMILSAAMCCAFMLSTTAMAQDSKTIAPKTKTECCTHKECKGDKKDCHAKKSDTQKSCCVADKK